MRLDVSGGIEQGKANLQFCDKLIWFHTGDNSPIF